MTLRLLAPEWRIGDLWLTRAPYLVPFGFDPGVPDAAAQVLTSFLTDGGLEQTTRRGNRTIVLPVLVEGSDLANIAEAENALRLECDKPLNVLYHDPGDGFAEPYRFTVFRGVVTWQRDDNYERAGYRLFSVEFRAKPWPEADTVTVVSSLAASGSSTTTIDDGTSATGWTAKVNGSTVSPGVVSGAVKVSATTSAIIPPPRVNIAMTRTGSIDTSSETYIVVDWKAAAGAAVISFTALGDGKTLPLIAVGPSPTAGWTRSTFQASAASVSALAMTLVSSPPVALGTQTTSLAVDNITTTDVRPSLGSAMQQVRSVPIAGSAPSVGSLVVEHETDALGDVLIYTCPDDGLGYVPPCRVYRVAAGTSEAEAASGAYDSLATVIAYDIPVAALPPGEYLVMTRTRGQTDGSSPDSAVMTWTYTPRLNGFDLTAVSTADVAVPTLEDYTLSAVGMATLPSMGVAPGPTAVMRLTATVADPGDEIFLDELYLFNLTVGRLSRVACGTGAPSSAGLSNRLWFDSPSSDNEGREEYWFGFAADRSDARSAWGAVAAPTVHEFPPGVLKVFTLATGPDTAVNVSYIYRVAGHDSVSSGPPASG